MVAQQIGAGGGRMLGKNGVELVVDHVGDAGRAGLWCCDVPNWMDRLVQLLRSLVLVMGVYLEWVALDDVCVQASSLIWTGAPWGKDVDVDCSEGQELVGG